MQTLSALLALGDGESFTNVDFVIILVVVSLKHLWKETMQLLVIWDAMTLMWRHYNAAGTAITFKLDDFTFSVI